MILNIVTKLQKHQKKAKTELLWWTVKMKKMQTTCPRKWFELCSFYLVVEMILYDGEKPPFKGSFPLEPTALVTHKCSAAGSE